MVQPDTTVNEEEETTSAPTVYDTGNKGESDDNEN